jgi:hypothetical protein
MKCFVLNARESKHMGYNVFLYGKTLASSILHIKNTVFYSLLKAANENTN